MTKRQWIILASLFVFVLLVIVFGVSSKYGNEGKVTEQIPETQKPVDVAATGTRVEFIPEVPKNATATKPAESFPLKVGNEQTSFGIYSIAIKKDGFSPAEVVVKNGDTVKIEVTAVDGNSDFSIPSYGTYVAVNKGETKTVSFKPSTVGTFLFECRDFCPASGKVSGKFIVMPK